MSPRLPITTLALLAGLAMPVVAQDAPPMPGLNVRFEHVPVPGSSDANSVLNIAEDAYGFLWIGTYAGLHRYDGYGFTSFAHDPGDSTSLSSDWIESLCADREGFVWAGTFGQGLNRFDPATETFKRYRLRTEDAATAGRDTVTALLEDHTGALWVGTHAGLLRFDRETATYEVFRHETHGLGNDQVRALYEDRDGTLWVGTRSPHPDGIAPGPGGVSRFDRRSERFVTYAHDPDDPQTLADNHVRGLLEDSRGTFWVGTHLDGLHTLDRVTGAVTRYPSSPTDPERLSRPHAGSQDYLTWSGISALAEDRLGGVWIAAWSTPEVVRYDPARGQTQRFSTEGWVHPNVWSALRTSDGTLWMGTFGGGLYKVKLVPQPFQVVRNPDRFLWWTLAVHYGAAGHLWQAGEDLLEHVPDGGQRWHPVPEQLGFVTALERSGENGLWVGGYPGSTASQEGVVYRYDPTERFYETVISDRPEEVGPVVALHEDDSGMLWIGSEQTGLVRLDLASGDLTSYADELPDPDVRVIVASSMDPAVLWIGTDDGLARLDRTTGTVTTLNHNTPRPLASLPRPATIGGRITSLLEASDGTLWVGTYGVGLSALDPLRESVTTYTSFDSGLPDNYVMCLLGDKEERLWMSSGSGLSRFDPSTSQFYTFSDATTSNLGAFNPGLCDASPEGSLTFAGANGFVRFTPRRLPTSTPPEVLLTGLALGGERVPPHPGGVLDRPLWMTDALTLTPDQHTFAVEATALDFRDPEANHYAFLLEGYDESWQEVGTQRTYRLARVPPGSYTLRVRAANADGVWSTEERTLAITVLPPWWRTWWAYVLYGLLFVAGVVAVDRIQRRRLVRRERERARERELVREREHAHEIERAYTELKEAKDRLVQQEKLASLGQLTAGIAHEIKNPLNFVTNFADVSGELAQEIREAARTGADLTPLLDELEQSARVIGEHGRRADGIVKGMMQHARASSGEKEAVDLNALVAEHVALAHHGRRAQTPGFDVTLTEEYDDAVGTVSVQPQEFGRVVVNLVTNAFDAVVEHAQTKLAAGNGEPFTPHVSVSTERTEEGIEVRVADNGPGIPDGLRAKIFEPFFTTKPTGSGTGLGLSLSYDIVTQGHGGTLSVESEESGGSTFTIRLPLSSVDLADADPVS